MGPVLRAPVSQSWHRSQPSVCNVMPPLPRCLQSRLTRRKWIKVGMGCPVPRSSGLRRQRRTTFLQVTVGRMNSVSKVKGWVITHSRRPKPSTGLEGCAGCETCVIIFVPASICIVRCTYITFQSGLGETFVSHLPQTFGALLNTGRPHRSNVFTCSKARRGVWPPAELG